MYVIANFGGPRTLPEVEPFLKELLCDQDVVRTGWPQPIHNAFFGRVARKRARKVREDYREIGGRSPIFADTEALAEQLRPRLDGPVLTFHRYLPATHDEFLTQLQAIETDEITLFPMFPQFTHATTGSIARWMQQRLPKAITQKLRWVKSYPTHPGFVAAYQNQIREFLHDQNIAEAETLLLFSAHGIPKKFLRWGDPYPRECEASVAAVAKAFPQANSLLCYQSKFGPGEWLRPYTSDVSADISPWARPHVVVVPISFTSDHIETLFEIETEYLPPIRKAGYQAHRCPALTLRPDWLDAIVTLLRDAPRHANESLIR